MKSTAFLASALFGSTSALVGPAWTYDSSVEKPTGEKTVGGSTFLVYTLEQQARLGVDASGQPATLASVGMSVNAGNHGWKACPMASMRFGDFSDVKKTLGARLRTDAGYVDAKLPIGEEDFAPATSIPAAFDSRTQWGSNCTVVTTVRDQSACGSWCVLLASSAFPYLRHHPLTFLNLPSSQLGVLRDGGVRDAQVHRGQGRHPVLCPGHRGMLPRRRIDGLQRRPAERSALVDDGDGRRHGR
jgi:hypothetical protein